MTISPSQNPSASAAPAAVSEPALTVRHVYAGYGPVPVLRDISLEVPSQSVVALVGPNGAGKSTLLKVVSGLLAPSQGSVILGSTDVTRLDVHRRRHAGICHIPEARGIYRSMTVRDNLRMQAARGQENQAVARAVEIFPFLGARLRQTAGTLSGGQQQMLSLSAAYVRGARVILVDEPSLGLAPVIVDAVFEFLEGIAGAAASLLIVDQFVGRVFKIASSVHLLKRGELTHLGPPSGLSDDLFEQYLQE